jgi:hypothetical protein
VQRDSELIWLGSHLGKSMGPTFTVIALFQLVYSSAGPSQRRIVRHSRDKLQLS